jgi:hypothetical protein
MSNQNPQQPFTPNHPSSQWPQPPKKHTARNIVIGVVAGFFLLIGGCTTLVGGALSSVDTTSEPTSSQTVDTGPSPDPVVTPTNKPTQRPATKTTPAPAPKPTKTAPEFTASQEQAIGSAEDYLSTGAFSKSGLIDQLVFEGFTKADARFAVAHITVNWNEQAALSAKSYLETSHFSRSGLISQLEFEGFTHAQAVYGANKAGL